MIPYSNHAECDTEIPNCKAGLSSSGSKTCEECDDLSLLSSDKSTCTPYQTEDCKSYDHSAGKCTECNQGYLVDSVTHK